MKRLRLALIPVALALVWVLVAGRAQAQQETAPAPFSVNDCRTCHEKPVAGMADTSRSFGGTKR